MRAEVYEGRGRKTNRWRWRIVAGNGRIIAVSGEAFYSERNARRALRTAVRNIKRADRLCFWLLAEGILIDG